MFFLPDPSLLLFMANGNQSLLSVGEEPGNLSCHLELGERSLEPYSFIVIILKEKPLSLHRRQGFFITFEMTNGIHVIRAWRGIAGALLLHCDHPKGEASIIAQSSGISQCIRNDKRGFVSYLFD